MSFLAPLYLALAAAVAVPLLLHLMRRRSGLRVDFPAARYLARAEQENSRKLRLRNLLLMLLRVAAVLLIVLAAARPIGEVAGAGHAPTALAIVVDNSMSTGVVTEGRPLLDDLKAAARGILARANPEDRLWLLTADGRVDAGSATALQAALADVQPFGGRGELSTAITRAVALVSGAGLPARQVAIATDAQSTAWDQSVAVDRVPTIVYTPSIPVTGNTAVIAAEARPVRWTPRGAIVARFAASDSVGYRIALGGRTLARGEAAPDAEVAVQAAPGGDGWTAGAVELDPDELRGDDVRHFAVWLGQPVAAAVDASAGAFAASAMATLAQSGRTTPGVDVVIAAAEAVPRLPALIIAPSDPVRLGAANRSLERLGIPWRFGALRRGRSALRGERLDGAAVMLRYELEQLPTAMADTLVTAAGNVWAVAGDGYVLIASPLQPAATELPIRAAFVPWLGDVLSQRLSAEPGAVVHAGPGQVVRLPLWVTALEGGAAVQLGDDGSVAAPREPGVYFLLRDQARAGALVVNPEPEESVLQRLSPAEVENRLSGRDVEVLSAAPMFVSSAFDRTGGQSLVPPLLAGALLLLAAESVVTRRSQRRA